MYHNVKGNCERVNVLVIHRGMTPLILLMLQLMVVLDLKIHYNNTMNQEWNVISQKKLVDSPWYKLNIETVRLPSGKVLDDYYVREGMNAVLIVPRTHEGKFLLVRQYKHGAQQSVIEFPAGKIDAGESALIAAKRELYEETGGASSLFVEGPTFFEDPTNSRVKIAIVFADNVTIKHRQHLDDNEDIEVIQLTPDGLRTMLMNNELSVAASVAAGWMALERRWQHEYIRVWDNNPSVC